MTEGVLKIKLSQLLSSLSFALDIAENRYYNHSRRTAYIAYSIAKELGLSEDDIIDTYFASLIHDIGMTGYLSGYSVMDIHNDMELVKKHCYFGYKVLENLPLGNNIKDYILYHHEEWNGTGPYGLKGDNIPLVSQIIHLADYFELFFVRKVEEFEQFTNLDFINQWLNICRGRTHNSRICDALKSLIYKEKFWFDLMSKNIGRALDIIEPIKDIYIDIDDLYNISESFSMLIDLKSKFTYDHSKEVSKITCNFATYLGYNPLMVRKLSIAANLHDIGKLAVPLSILEKPGELTNSEFLVIKSHPYYTKMILKHIEGIEDIAEWAGNHHEKLNGTGYPEKLDRKTLTREDEIIAIVDIYQALTEDRPYRKSVEHEIAMNIMSNMAERGEICKKTLDDFKGFLSYSEVLV